MAGALVEHRQDLVGVVAAAGPRPPRPRSRPAAGPRPKPRYQAAQPDDLAVLGRLRRRPRSSRSTSASSPGESMRTSDSGGSNRDRAGDRDVAPGRRPGARAARPPVPPRRNRRDPAVVRIADDGQAHGSLRRRRCSGRPVGVRPAASERSTSTPAGSARPAAGSIIASVRKWWCRSSVRRWVSGCPESSAAAPTSESTPSERSSALQPADHRRAGQRGRDLVGDLRSRAGRGRSSAGRRAPVRIAARSPRVGVAAVVVRAEPQLQVVQGRAGRTRRPRGTTSAGSPPDSKASSRSASCRTGVSASPVGAAHPQHLQRRVAPSAAA